MSKKGYIDSSIFLLFSLFTSSSVEAGTFLNLDYSLDVEQHKNESDSQWSEFSLNVVNAYKSSSFNADIDFTADLVYEHQSDEDNSLWLGEIISTYKFNNALSMLLNAEFSELNSVSSIADYDRLRSETVVNLATGVEFKLTQGFRGEFSTTILNTAYVYEDSPLDANELSFEIAYVYPFSIASFLTVTASLLEQKYDDSVESLNDIDNKQFRIEYDKRFSRISVGLFIENNEVEYLNQELNDSLEAYGFNVNYNINSRATLSLEYGSEVQQIYSINANLINPLNPVLTSGLVENKRYTIQYNYTTSFNNVVLQVYQNDIKDVSPAGSNFGLQEGVQFNYTQHINEKIDMALSYDQIKNEINDSESTLSSAILNYKVSQSRKNSSIISLIVEEEDSESVNESDVILNYKFMLKIY